MNKRKTCVILFATLIFLMSTFPVFAAEKGIEKTFEYIGSENDKYAAKESITQDGKKYKLVDVTYETKPLEKVKKVETKDRADYKKEIEITVEGKKYKLVASNDIKWKEPEIITISESREYKTKNEIPSSISKDNKELALKSVSDTTKVEAFSAPAKFVAYDSDSTEYIFNGKKVIINGNTPVWNGYQADIKDYLGIAQNNNYTLSGGSFTSALTLVDQDEERYERTAVFTGTKVVPYYIANYEYRGAKDDGTYIADVKYTSKDKYMITATAIYEEDISNNNLKTALMIGAAVLVFAVAASLIIFFLKKREKEGKNE